MVNIFGGLNGDLIVPGTEQYLGSEGSVNANNTNPGEGSTNNQTASSLDQTSVANSNNVQLNNNVNANGVSGENQQNGNDDGDGNHTTTSGGTDVATNIMNYLNLNISGNNFVFLIVNVFGKWMGQIVGFADNSPLNAPDSGTFAALSLGGGQGENVTATNSNTGEDSVNNATVNSTNTTNVANNNGAIVNNNINVEGVSGQNAVNNNDAGTSLTTGWVEIDANLLNIINTNVTGRSWMVVFVNVFGDFMGNLFFGQQAADSYAAAHAQQNNSQAIGGVSESNNSSSQTSNQSQSQQVEDFVIPTTQPVNNTSKKLSNKSVLASSVAAEEESNVYTGVYEENESQETEAYVEEPGLLAKIKGFLYSIYTSLRGIVEPIFAWIGNVSPLS